MYRCTYLKVREKGKKRVDNASLRRFHEGGFFFILHGIQLLDDLAREEDLLEASNYGAWRSTPTTLSPRRGESVCMHAESPKQIKSAGHPWLIGCGLIMPAKQKHNIPTANAATYRRSFRAQWTGNGYCPSGKW